MLPLAMTEAGFRPVHVGLRSLPSPSQQTMMWLLPKGLFGSLCNYCCNPLKLYPLLPPVTRAEGALGSRGDHASYFAEETIGT